MYLKKKCIHMKINANDKSNNDFFGQNIIFSFFGGRTLHLYVMIISFICVCFCLIAEDNLIGVISKTRGPMVL